jgi:hypothetical protein
VAALTSKQRNALPDSDFALPGREYPLENKEHARKALQLGAAHATPSELNQIKRKVRAKYPDIAVDGRQTQLTHGRKKS